MKTMMRHATRAVLAVMLAGGLWWLAARPEWLRSGVGMALGLAPGLALLLGLGSICALLFRRVRSEDRIADFEAALCRQRSAHCHADRALLEADLLLARMTVGAASGGAADPAGQMRATRADVAQFQQPCDTARCIRQRLAPVRARMQRPGAGRHRSARAIEPG